MTSTRPGPLAAALLAAAQLATTATGCSKCRRARRAKARAAAIKQAKAFAFCTPSDKCRSPNLCVGLKSHGVNRHICAFPCKDDDACPEDFACTGSFIKYRTGGVGHLSGPGSRTIGKYCRPANVGLGGRCLEVKRGCEAGLHCVEGTCLRTCEDRGGCLDDEICVNSYVNVSAFPRLHSLTGMPDLPGRPAPHDRADEVSVCMERLVEGARCTSKGGGACIQGHFCHRRRCRKICKDARDCAASQACTGQGTISIRKLLGIKRTDATREQRKPITFSYCQKRY